MNDEVMIVVNRQEAAAIREALRTSRFIFTNKLWVSGICERIRDAELRREWQERQARIRKELLEKDYAENWEY